MDPFIQVSCDVCLPCLANQFGLLATGEQAGSLVSDALCERGETIFQGLFLLETTPRFHGAPPFH
jgi:hypothetical protein